MSIRHPGRVKAARAAQLNNAAETLLDGVRGVLCEDSRTRIVRALTAGPLAVGDLAHVIGLTKSATSQHLRVLREGGIVQSRRRGRVVYYSLADVKPVAAAVRTLELVNTLAA